MLSLSTLYKLHVPNMTEGGTQEKSYEQIALSSRHGNSYVLLFREEFCLLIKNFNISKITNEATNLPTFFSKTTRL